MIKSIAIVAAIAFASFAAQAQVAQKNNGIIVQPGVSQAVAIQKNAVKKNIVHAVYVADATRTSNMGTARMVGRNYVGTETGIEGIDFNRK